MATVSTNISDFCTSQSRKVDFQRMLLIVMLGLITYSNTLNYPFIFDDYANIVNNPQIIDLTFAGIKNALVSKRAIGIITFQLNYYYFGLNLLSYHLVNIVVHITSSLAVYKLLQLLMETPYILINSDDEYRKLPLPLFSALIFVVHPVQTQAVTYIVQRFASLAALFYLLALISYLKARISLHASGSHFTWKIFIWSAACSLFTFAAFFTKETAFTLPLAIILIELLFFSYSAKKLCWFFSAGGALVIAIISKYSVAGHFGQGILKILDESTRMQTITSRWDYLFTQFRVIMTYMRLIAFPVNQRLDYDYELSQTFFDWRVFCSFLIIIAFLLGAARLIKLSAHGSPHLRLAAFGILWFFLTLSVESSIIPIIDLIFEHRIYLPLFGAVTAVCSTVITSLWRRGESTRNTLCFWGFILTLLLGVISFNRNSVWKSEVSVWADTVKKSPNSARAWNNLGASYIKQGEPLSALKAVIRSVELDPSKADAMNNLGIAIDLMGAYNDRFNKTAEMFISAESIENKVVSRWLGDVNNNLGLGYEIIGNLPKAAESYRNSVGYNPSLGLAYYNLGILSAKMGDAGKYHEQLQILWLLDPALAERLQLRVGLR